MARTKSSDQEKKQRKTGGKHPRGILEETKEKTKKVALRKTIAKEPREKKKTHLTRRELKVLREIKKAQKHEGNLVPKASFTRLAREVAQELGANVRVTKSAFLSLQLATEDFLGDLMENANKLAMHRKKVTLNPCDMFLAAEMTTSDPAYKNAIDIKRWRIEEKRRSAARKKKFYHLPTADVEKEARAELKKLPTLEERLAHQRRTTKVSTQGLQPLGQVDAFLASTPPVEDPIEDDGENEYVPAVEAPKTVEAADSAVGPMPMEA